MKPAHPTKNPAGNGDYKKKHANNNWQIRRARERALTWSPPEIRLAHHPVSTESPTRSWAGWGRRADRGHISGTVIGAADRAALEAAVDAVSRTAAASRNTTARSGNISILELLLFKFGLLLLCFVDRVPFVRGMISAVTVQAYGFICHSRAFAFGVVVAGDVFDIFTAVTPLIDHIRILTHDWEIRCERVWWCFGLLFVLMSLSWLGYFHTTKPLKKQSTTQNQTPGSTQFEISPLIRPKTPLKWKGKFWKIRWGRRWRLWLDTLRFSALVLVFGQDEWWRSGKQLR